MLQIISIFSFVNNAYSVFKLTLSILLPTLEHSFINPILILQNAFPFKLLTFIKTTFILTQLGVFFIFQPSKLPRFFFPVLKFALKTKYFPNCKFSQPVENIVSKLTLIKKVIFCKLTLSLRLVVFHASYVPATISEDVITLPRGISILKGCQ